MTEELCACGQPLHYTSDLAEAYVRAQVTKLGETVLVTTFNGSWKVPRHYIALHGLKEVELPAFAIKYGWPKIS